MEYRKGLAMFVIVSAILIAIFGSAQLVASTIIPPTGDDVVSELAVAVLAFLQLSPVATLAVIARVAAGFLYRFVAEKGDEEFDVNKMYQTWLRMVPAIAMLQTMIDALLPLHPELQYIAVVIVFLVDTVGIAFKNMRPPTIVNAVPPSVG